VVDGKSLILVDTRVVLVRRQFGVIGMVRYLLVVAGAFYLDSLSDALE
jgi:hypothetical protein